MKARKAFTTLFTLTALSALYVTAPANAAMQLGTIPKQARLPYSAVPHGSYKDRLTMQLSIQTEHMRQAEGQPFDAEKFLTPFNARESWAQLRKDEAIDAKDEIATQQDFNRRLKSAETDNVKTSALNP